MIASEEKKGLMSEGSDGKMKINRKPNKRKRGKHKNKIMKRKNKINKNTGIRKKASREDQ